MTPTISVNSLNLFKSIFTIMGYLFKDGKKFVEDYRISLIKSMSSVTTEVGGWVWSNRS